MAKTNKEKLTTKETVIQILKFVAFSMGAGIIQIVSYTIIHELTDCVHWKAYLPSLILSVLYNFTVNRKFTFKSATNVPIAMLKVALFYCVFTPVSLYLGQIAEDDGINNYIVEAVTMACNLVTEYLFCRFVVYRNSMNTNDITDKKKINDGVASIKKEIINLRKNIYRSTSIMFIVQLFGALGAGFFFVIQNVLGIEHILDAAEKGNEQILWFILFWATDFFFIAFTVVTSYLIAGLPAIAPSLALSVYFCHFAGNPVPANEMYVAYFATPLNNGGGANIGYMGYFIMAIALSLLIKYLYIAWDKIKESLGKKLDKPLSKIKFIPENFGGTELLEQIDLIVLVLILPVASCALTFLLIRYGVQLPFNALGEALVEPLTNLTSSNFILSAVVIGLMVGFDLIGPVSMAAFSVAVAMLLSGDARFMTIYGACFVCLGWIPLFTMIIRGIIKKKSFKLDTDDSNLATTGPINAFFENIKLTVSFSMTNAYRSPLAIIPGYMIGSAVTGLLVALFKITNTAYINELPKYGNGYTFEELFKMGEYYISFTLPLRSGDWLTCRIPLFFIILGGAAVGGFFTVIFRHIAFKIREKAGTNVETNGDIVLEMRKWAQKLSKNPKAE